jgi:hypothetical protein
MVHRTINLLALFKIIHCAHTMMLQNLLSFHHIPISLIIIYDHNMCKVKATGFIANRQQS